MKTMRFFVALVVSCALAAGCDMSDILNGMGNSQDGTENTEQPDDSDQPGDSGESGEPGDSEPGTPDQPDEPVEPEAPAGVIKATVEEFLNEPVDDTQYYMLTGTLENLTDAEYGDFDLVDETGAVYVYGLTSEPVSKNDKSFWLLGLKEGDVITIIGTRDEYKGKAQVGGPAYYFSRGGSGGTAPDPDPNPGTGGGSGQEPGYNPDANITTAWLELPAMPENSGLEYYSHYFNMNGKEYRNYSFGWSQKDYVALWVAYPLCSFYTKKNVSRTDDWAYDPLLGPDKSSAPFSGYGNEYSRGHQVASSDRLCCYEANAQTFYGTNMTPQDQALNGAIWNDLEMQARSWASAVDTIYVVTGCIVKGSNERVPDSDGNMMTVPTAYWKALLSYDRYASDQWSCAAFYFEHRKYSNTSLSAVSMSVDELEEITGLDLFVNLPAKVGEAKAQALEAADPKTSGGWF